MAQALFSLDEAQFTCCICLELLRDPVTAPCGHSFCMGCLTDLWDRQPVCSCPQCRATFSPRPALGRNTLLTEMVQKLGAMALYPGPSAPPLDQDPRLAGGSGFEHATFDVSSARPERTDGERHLGDTRRHLSQQIAEKESELQQLKEAMRTFSCLAKVAAKDSSRMFSELLQFLERRRVEVKELIRAQEKAEVTRAENRLQQLEQQISELKRRDGELERLSRGHDQRLITQMCQAFDSPARPGETPVVSPHVSFGSVRAAVSDLKEHLQHLYHTEYPNITSAVKNIHILQMEEAREVEVAAGAPCPLNSRSDLLQHLCRPSLDPFTAHRELLLSQGNRVVSRTGEFQPYPDHPDRFDSWCQVLCREGLRGRRYWEAEWSGQQVALGLAYEGIGRKGSSNDSRLGHNALSWGLRCGSSAVAFIHGGQEQPVAVPSGAKPRRIGVFLDHGAGLLCFYAVTPAGVHLLHRVAAEFGPPLYPAAWLGTKSAVSFCAVD